MTDPSHSSALTNRVIGDPEMRRLLIVDDEETIRVALSKFLRSRGYDVETSDSGAAALEKLESSRFALMLSDIRMPGMSGLELVPLARSLDEDLAVVMLSAVNDAPSASDSIARGAMEYLTKPIDLQDLLNAIERVLHRRDLEVERRNVERLIGDEVVRRTADLARHQGEVVSAAVATIANFVAVYEERDPFFGGMSLRVAALARAIAIEMGLEAAEVEDVSIAARLHDAGRIALREAVLNKPASLSDEEFEHVKEHIRVGTEILAPLAQLRKVLEFVRDHHEHWDGTGYPRGVSGEQISLGGRILCAADAFIALTSRRAYRDAMTSEGTLDFLAAHAGSLLDPAVYETLRTVVSEGHVLGLSAD